MVQKNTPAGSNDDAPLDGIASRNAANARPPYFNSVLVLIIVSYFYITIDRNDGAAAPLRGNHLRLPHSALFFFPPPFSSFHQESMCKLICSAALHLKKNKTCKVSCQQVNSSNFIAVVIRRRASRRAGRL